MKYVGINFANVFFIFCWCVLSLFIWVGSTRKEKRGGAGRRGINSGGECGIFAALSAFKCFISKGGFVFWVSGYFSKNSNFVN